MNIAPNDPDFRSNLDQGMIARTMEVLEKRSQKRGLASGLSSSTVGTMAGQVVVQGFVGLVDCGAHYRSERIRAVLHF